MTLAIFPSGAGGGGGATVDRFAPRYLLGIAGAGFPATPQGAPWVYVQDTGDGQGLAAVIAMAAIDPGPIQISPGVIDLATGPVLGPIVVPGNVQVRGSGRGVTTIKGPKIGNQGVFALNAGSDLSDLTIAAGALDVGSIVAVAAVELLAPATMNRVDITTSRPAGGTLLCCVRAFYAGAPIAFSRLTDCSLTSLTAAPEPPAIESCGVDNASPDDSGIVVLTNVVIIGGNWGVLARKGSTIAGLVVAVDQQFGAFRSDSAGGSFQLVGFGAIVGASASSKWVGVDVTAGGPAWIERGALVGDGQTGRYVGVRIGGGGGVNGLGVESCFAIGMGIGFQAGTFAGGSAQLVSFVDCAAIESSLFGMWLGPATQLCNVRGFKCSMLDAGLPFPGPEALHVDGSNHAIASVQLDNSTARGSALVTLGTGHTFTGALAQCAGDAAGWEHGASRCTLGSCVVTMTTGSPFPALSVTGDDCAISGNSCVAGTNSGVSAIQVASAGCAVTGNRTTTDAGIAGVTLLGASVSCAVTGTVARGAGAGNAVVDLGAGNIFPSNLGW